MSTYNVITDSFYDKTDRIVFWADESEYSAKELICDKFGVLLVVSPDQEAYLGLKSKEHAENLIKALNKAIELGWFDKEENNAI